MIYRAPFFLPWLYPNLVWRIPGNDKKLYLTFDDGPIPGPTDFVLETLAKHNIKATFFCIGDNIRKHPEVLKRILAQGHETANHTFNHLKGWSTPLDKYIDNVRQCDAVLENFEFRISNLEPPPPNPEPRTSKLFRPPYGRITRAQINALPDYKIIMWDVLTNDYNLSTTPEACLKNSIRVTRPGSVIVFHDSLKAERNMTYTLPRYIEHCQKQGYSFNLLPNE